MFAHHANKDITLMVESVSVAVQQLMDASIAQAPPNASTATSASLSATLSASLATKDVQLATMSTLAPLAMA